MRHNILFYNNNDNLYFKLRNDKEVNTVKMRHNVLFYNNNDELYFKLKTGDATQYPFLQ